MSQAPGNPNNFRWSTRVRWLAGSTATVYARNNAFQIEQQASFKEADLHPSAVEYLLGAVGGELEALRSLQRGESDACAVLDLNWTNWQADGTADPSKLMVLATTPLFDHCNFTVLESFPSQEEERWREVLFRMSYSNPAHREMMDMEGLKEWLPGRTSGYAILSEAVTDQKFFENGA